MYMEFILKQKTFFLIFCIIVLTVAIGYVLFFEYSDRKKESSMPNASNSGICTMEAKICPDGSSVGRSGPNCEFAPCPEAYEMLKIKEDTNLGISFSYPENMSLSYMHPESWPPKVSVVKGTAEKDAIVFTDFPEAQVRVGVHPGIPSVSKRMVDNRVYCVRTSSEGAAGSTYETSVYELYKEGRLIIGEVIMRKTNCENYDDPKRLECKGERETFDLDSVMDKILQSVIFEK